MRLRTLGRTGLEVSELALGGLGASRSGEEAVEQTRQSVRRAVQLGINYIDTAPGYGSSEEVLGRVLPEIKTPLILSTKLGYRPEPFEPRNLDCLRRSFDTSLRRLGRDQIDMLMIHEPDRPGQFDWWTSSDPHEGPVLEFLADLKRQGLIRFAGLGGTTAYELVPIMRTGRFDVVLTAFNYSLLWREAEIAILPAARELGIGVIAGSPLQQGALARRWDDEVNGGAAWLSPPRRRQFQALYGLLDDLGMSIVELAMRFVISNPDVSCVLTGSRTPQEVEQNVDAISRGPLPADVMARLEQIGRMVPFRPFEEPFGLPFGRSRGPVGKAR